MSREEALFKGFIADGNCLIVDPSAAFCSNMSSSLVAFGLSPSQVKTAKNFESAKKLTKELKPRLLVTEFQVGESFGLSLVEDQEKMYDENSRISVIASSNNSNSVVAEAAEEQIDIFILKPFSMDTFQKKVASTIEKKMMPSPYTVKIRESRELILKQQYAEAWSLLDAAMKLNPKPTMAHCLKAEALIQQKKLAEAVLEFKAGRQYQPLHYKCLVGEFETQIDLKKYKEAYELIDVIRKNYPVTPARLNKMIMSAVYSFKFDDLFDFYEIYKSFDQRDPGLAKIMATALLTAGKFAVKDGDLGKAMKFFETGLFAAAKNLDYVEKIINELLKGKGHHEAQLILTRVNPEDITLPAFRLISFRVDEFVLTDNQVIESGKKLINDGMATAEVYRTVVRLLAKQKRNNNAEAVISQAISQFPDLRKELYAMLES
jgi:tetratricopeptide (TPR) repeat protein